MCGVSIQFEPKISAITVNLSEGSVLNSNEINQHLPNGIISIKHYYKRIINLNKFQSFYLINHKPNQQMTRLSGYM